MKSNTRLSHSGRHLRRQLRWTLGLLSVSAVAAAASAQTPFRGLIEEMSAAERAATGVERLTDAEQQALEQWLRQRFEGLAVEEPTPAAVGQPAPNGDAVAGAEAVIAAEVARRVAEEVAAVKDAEAVEDEAPFEASLLAPFDGWRGKTQFRLDNGQVWQQRASGTYIHRGNDLRVRFKKNWIGGWEMRLIDSDKAVLVRRLK